MNSLAIRFSLCLCMSMLAGCGAWRGIPTHGGGKRFDEEQRVVAGAIRRTLADMELTELLGKKVAISMECISQDGGGVISFPGINGVNAGVSGSYGTGNIVTLTPSNQPGGSSVLSDNNSSGAGGNAGVSYAPQVSYSPSVMSSLPDVSYFHAALEMKARHAGLNLVAAEPEAVLYVLVDVLGTNRSRTDAWVWNTETLQAACECTYYALDPKSGQLIFQARRASSEATYRETRHFGVMMPQIDRSIARTPPTPLPVDEPAKPSTQPSVAKRKPWFGEMLSRLAGTD
jgi:hypothetical protein